MKRTNVFNDNELAEAFKRSFIGEKFFVGSRNGKAHDRTEQNRVYAAAAAAGRQITMRKFREGWKSTVIE